MPSSADSASPKTDWLSTRSQLGLAVRHGRPEAELTELRRTLRYQRLFVLVRDVIDGDPPLTSDQRARIADFLTGGDGQ